MAIYQRLTESSFVELMEDESGDWSYDGLVELFSYLDEVFDGKSINPKDIDMEFAEFTSEQLVSDYGDLLDQEVIDEHEDGELDDDDLAEMIVADSWHLVTQDGNYIINTTTI